MPTDPTPAEVERAKKWASMQTPPVTVGDYIGPKHWSIVDYPSFLDFEYGQDTLFDSADAAWTALALALRPVFASVGPVVREECAAVCDASVNWRQSPHIQIGLQHAAAAIRAMS